jgi:hypothetical protein
MKKQFIVICLKDSSEKHPATYVQVTRRRFISKREANTYMEGVSPERTPVAIPVAAVEVDENNYPIYTPF